MLALQTADHHPLSHVAPEGLVPGKERAQDVTSAASAIGGRCQNSRVAAANICRYKNEKKKREKKKRGGGGKGRKEERKEERKKGRKKERKKIRRKKRKK